MPAGGIQYELADILPRGGGAMEECETAILTREVFAARLQILGLLVSPPSIEFEFDDDGMSAGHAVFVTAFDGVEFSDVQATLFG